MARGLGKGLDSLIPNIYDEDFDSNSAQSLEDMMKEEEETVEEVIDDIESKTEEIEEPEDVEDDSADEESENDVEETESEEENDKGDITDSNGSEEIQEEVSVEQEKEEPSQEDETSEDLSGDSGSEENIPTSQKIEVHNEHVDEVREIVNKNPRITLWSSRSSAVFRYLRKTEPEFSISKEASVLIEEAVAKKYPDIWALFEDL